MPGSIHRISRLNNRHIQTAIFLFAVTAFGMNSASAQAPAFDYQGDTKAVPAEISVGVEAGEYRFVESTYRLFKLRQSGTRVRMDGFHTMTSPGNPALPERILEVALPPNVDLQTVKLSVDVEQTDELPGEYDILPAPPLRARVNGEELVNWGHGKAIVAGQNMHVYAEDAYFPATAAQIIAHSQMRKWRFVQVAFTPLQYNPVKKSLRLARSIRLRLSFMRIGKTMYRSDPLLSDKLMDEFASRRFLNFKQAQEWYRYVPGPDPGTAVEDPDYVIITTNTIRDNSTRLADFVAHKTAFGHATRIVTEDDYGVMGDAQAIRDWLAANYVALGIHYLLLIGDPDPDDPDDPGDTVGDVPMLMAWPHRNNYRHRETPTDYFYADLSGDWDLDGDGRYGEHAGVAEPMTPDPVIDPDTFSVRWSGKIRADIEGDYLFATVSDDGIRLVIDGTAIIDNWAAHPVTTDYAAVALGEGLHDIEVVYYNDTGDGIASVLWRPPGQDYLGVVPGTKLYHEVAGSDVSGGLDAEYFNRIDFTDPALTRVDMIIDFVWATGDRGIGGVDFTPELFIGRIPVYAADYAALDAILQKIIDYETGAPPAWRRSLLTTSVFMWPGESDYQLGEALKTDFADPLGYTTQRIYESDFGIVPAPECTAINPGDAAPGAPCNMLGEWANGGGYGLLTWSTHGDAISASQLIESSDNRHLDDTAPAFVFQGSCLNGYPELSNNLGYALLRQGAIGTVSASRVSWGNIFNPPSDPNPLSGSTPNLAYQYSAGLMQDQAAGHALYLATADVRADSDWMNKMAFNLYGDPSAALFRSSSGIALLFDRSGSMSWSHAGVPGVPVAEQRLSLAKQAAYPMVELLNDFAGTRVNLGIAAFPSHPWDASGGCDAQILSPMARVDHASSSDAIAITIPGLAADGNTPLLAGLDSALGAFAAEAPRAIVLLSDGYHNCPSMIDAFDPAVDTLVRSLNSTSTRVYTIGFGRPGDIDHPLLNRLAEDTGGVFYDVTTPDFDPATWSPATELQATYKAILVDALGLETALDPLGVIAAGKSVSHQVKINEYDRRVSVFLSWQTPQSNRLTLRVRTSDGHLVPVMPRAPGISVHQGRSYQIVTFHPEFLRKTGKIGPTPWELTIGASGLDQGEREYYQYSVIVDSALTMDVTLDREYYRVGDPIVLEARLAAGQQPITGLKDVRVRVSRPIDGIGNWFAHNRVSADELDKIPAVRQGETLSPIQRKATYLYEVRRITGPGRLSPIDIRLFDDGTHSDRIAGDGVYTNSIGENVKEGSYAFKVHASGTTTAGYGYDRDASFNRYLIPGVSAEHTALVAVRQQSNSPSHKRFALKITPRDALGNYLGPHYAGAIRLKAGSEVKPGPLTDNLDGSYTQLMEIDQNTNVANLKIVLRVQDMTLSFLLGDKLIKHGSAR